MNFHISTDTWQLWLGETPGWTILGGSSQDPHLLSPSSLAVWNRVSQPQVLRTDTNITSCFLTTVSKSWGPILQVGCENPRKCPLLCLCPSFGRLNSHYLIGVVFSAPKKAHFLEYILGFWGFRSSPFHIPGCSFLRVASSSCLHLSFQTRCIKQRRSQLKKFPTVSTPKTQIDPYH